jgi:hypothetical protein
MGLNFLIGLGLRSNFTGSPRERDPFIIIIFQKKLDNQPSRGKGQQINQQKGLGRNS